MTTSQSGVGDSSPLPREIKLKSRIERRLIAICDAVTRANDGLSYDNLPSMLDYIFKQSEHVKANVLMLQSTIQDFQLAYCVDPEDDDDDDVDTPIVPYPLDVDDPIIVDESNGGEA